MEGYVPELPLPWIKISDDPALQAKIQYFTFHAIKISVTVPQGDIF